MSDEGYAPSSAPEDANPTTVTDPTPELAQLHSAIKSDRYRSDEAFRDAVDERHESYHARQGEQAADGKHVEKAVDTDEGERDAEGGYDQAGDDGPVGEIEFNDGSVMVAPEGMDFDTDDPFFRGVVGWADRNGISGEHMTELAALYLKGSK